MTTAEKYSDLDYPSLQSAFLFWEKAKEEYANDDIISQKDGCEKAFRAATEAIDTFLAQNGYIVPIGKPEAHLKRDEYLVALIDLNPDIWSINSEYSAFKNQLHGICFYSGIDPKKYASVFERVEPFLLKIQELIAN